MARLTALAHHWRGVVYESAPPPRAAADAYRAAQAAWRRSRRGRDEGRRTTERLDALTGAR